MGLSAFMKSSATCFPWTKENGQDMSLLSKFFRTRGAVIFKAGYRGGRIFGGLPNYFASSNWAIKEFWQKLQNI